MNIILRLLGLGASLCDGVEESRRADTEKQSYWGSSIIKVYLFKLKIEVDKQQAIFHKF